MSTARAVAIPGIDPLAPTWVRERPRLVVARGPGYALYISIPPDRPKRRPLIAVTWRPPRGLHGPMPHGGRWYRCWRERPPRRRYWWSATLRGAHIGHRGACADSLHDAMRAAEAALRELREERERTDPFFRHSGPQGV